jgi:hypothetical protein
MRDVGIRSEPVVGERMETVGVDWGPKGIILIHRDGDFGVFKIPGHQAWNGNFMPWRYHATRYGIVNIEQFAPAKSNSHWGRVDLLNKSEMTPGAAWRSAIADLENEVRALAAGEVGALDMYELLQA